MRVVAPSLEEIGLLARRVKAAQARADQLRAELVAAVRASSESQADIAKAASVSRQRVGQWVRGEGSAPSR